MRRFIYFFQLGCTSEHFSFFFLFSPVASGRCQETVTSHGINSFSPILPDFLLEETRLFAEPRNTLERPVLIVRRPPTPSIHPSSPHFPQDLYPWVCGRLLFRIPWYTRLRMPEESSLSLSLSGRHWNDTGSLMPPNLLSYPFLFIASIEQDEINLYTQFLHGSARIRLSSRYGTWRLDLGWAAFLETREDVGGRSWIIWGFWEYLMNTFRIFIDDLMIHRLEIKDIGSMIGFSFKLLRNNIEIIFY